MDREAEPSECAPCIGVFDSGVGGLSVLRALQRQMPRARLLYVADSAHSPYGEREDAFIVARAHAMTEHLLSQGAQMVVVACNTATAVAIESLRESHPSLPLVGVEPGLKPAVARTLNRRIGVMATRATLASARFQRLTATHAAGIDLHLQACHGLAHALEAGDADGELVGRLIRRHTAPLREAGVDTVVLGCTHYPFAAHRIAEALGPAVDLIDTADAVARQARRVASELQQTTSAEGGRAVLWTNGDPARLRGIAARWLAFQTETRSLSGG